MTNSIIPIPVTRRVVCLLTMLVLLVFPAFAAAHPAVAPQPPLYDLGDAPDSSNHPGLPMSAYAGRQANFPTVYDPVTGLPPGPRHFDPDAYSWLGADVSEERDADRLPDEDGVRNIIPAANDPDNDGF